MKVGDIVRIKNRSTKEELIVRVDNVKNDKVHFFTLLYPIRKASDAKYNIGSPRLCVFGDDIITRDITKREEDLIMAQLI